ncbi:MAG: DegT/DnrJ/EryC1/StrS aminotransferase family protein [Firmicutes bacterium]|nr:DegT/DnrJ/EryC1/StrS aminotransferase family protein [Bacillota bacterium]
MKISFSPPDITEKEIAYAAEALRSGWITTGPRTKELERRIAAFTGTAKAVCLNSATASLELSLRLLGIGPGDQVITSAYTYTASASVIHHVGAEIVLIDTDGSSYEMDYDALEAAITEKTKAVIPVDYAGAMCDYDRIFAAVENKKHLFSPSNDLQRKIGRVAVVADSVHGFGASRNGKKSGTAADITCFSFHAVKNLTTAEGGAVVWNPALGLDDEEIYKWFMLASLHGQSKDALAKTAVGSWEYDIVYPAYKCNMTDIMAAIGLAQLERYPDLLARRREIIGRYDAAFRPLGLIPLEHYGDDRCSSGHLYPLRVPGADEERRNGIIRLMGEKGVACNVHYKPLPMMTAYRDLGFDIKDFPNAFAQYRNEVTLPLHTKLTDEEVGYVISSLKEVLG